MKYECHITLRKSDAGAAGCIVGPSWHTSEIAGDPELGGDTHFYLTMCHDKYDVIFVHMDVMVSQLHEIGIKPLRVKIEQTIYDVRYS